MAEAATWWVVLAHELTHNLVSHHNSEHSYYTESFIQQYMGKMIAKTAQWTQALPRRSLPPPPQESDAGAYDQPPPYTPSA